MAYKRIKGTKDILPDEVWKWEFVEGIIKKHLKNSGYREIRTPIFEMTELFTRSIGEETDVVSKEMYTFEDKGGKSLTLRPELTAPVIRAYIQNKMNQINPIKKLYYIGSLFRQERPQKGRLRQFNQFGIEVIGAPTPEADAEVIRLMYDIFIDLGINQMKVKINSIGGKESRTAYLKILADTLNPHFDQLCSTCQTRFNKNILRIFDCKNDNCQSILDDYAPAIVDHLNKDEKQHFAEVKMLLDATKTPYSVEKKLVRGLDYYTQTTFEISSSLLGSQDAICGGGRYDNLVEDLGAKSTPAVGVACGIERLLLILDEQDNWGGNEESTIFFVTLGEKAIIKGFEFVTDFRKAGISAEMDFMRRSMKAQMRNAGKRNANYVIIIGDQEVDDKIVKMKNMSKGEQFDVSFDGLIEKVQQLLKRL